MGFPRRLSDKKKKFACSARASGDVSSIPGLERSPKGGHGNPLQYSCLENPMDRGTWQVTVHRVAKSWTWLRSNLACAHNRDAVHGTSQLPEPVYCPSHYPIQFTPVNFHDVLVFSISAPCTTLCGILINSWPADNLSPKSQVRVWFLGSFLWPTVFGWVPWKQLWNRDLWAVFNW